MSLARGEALAETGSAERLADWEDGTDLDRAMAALDCAAAIEALSTTSTY